MLQKPRFGVLIINRKDQSGGTSVPGKTEEGQERGARMIAFIAAAVDDPGDREFMERFYLEHERLMYATVRKWLDDSEAAKDIVQESVLRLIPKISFLRQQERCVNASYVVSTVRNTTINYLRRRSRAEGRCASLEEGEEPAVPQVSLDELVLLTEQRERLARVWVRLTEEEQLLLEGKYILGYEDGELAGMPGCKKDSVRMKLTRARRRALRLMLEEGGGQP